MRCKRFSEKSQEVVQSESCPSISQPAIKNQSLNPSSLAIDPPSPTPLTLSWWSDKNSNNPEGESGILTMAGAHNWQEPLTAPSCPSQAPFEPLSPLQLPPKPRLTAPQAPRPASGQKVAEIGKIICCWCTVAEVCLEWDKESLPCQEFCACAVRALRARSARPRLQSPYRHVGPFEPDRHVVVPACLLTIHGSSHAILLSLRLRVTRDHTTPSFSKLNSFCVQWERSMQVSYDWKFLLLLSL